MTNVMCMNKGRFLGGLVLHSVDATDLRGTFLPQCSVAEYDVIVFPFPRASLVRGVDPRNPRLLRNFFRSVNDVGEHLLNEFALNSDTGGWSGEFFSRAARGGGREGGRDGGRGST